jgi:hypothetical protein
VALRPERSFVLAVGILALLTAVGTAGFVLLEHLRAADALYLTVTTLSTVG